MKYPFLFYPALSHHIHHDITQTTKQTKEQTWNIILNACLVITFQDLAHYPIRQKKPSTSDASASSESTSGKLKRCRMKYEAS